jgi:hypothetical protein
MPTVLQNGNWRFHFYSDEEQEPPHIHVQSGDGESKYWLVPVRLARSQRVPATELRRIERAVVLHETQLLEAWHAFFRR